MENMICTPETNVWVLMLISFAVGCILPAIGRYVKEKYDRAEQE